MRHPVHDIWCDTYFDVIEEWRQRYEKDIYKYEKMKIKDTNIFNTVGFCI